MLTALSSYARATLGPAGRRRARQILDPLLSPIGTIHRGRIPRSVVALTFDDGPDPEVTPRILDILAAHGARATFFVLTDKAAQSAALVRRMVAEGHEVGLHCDRHDRLTLLPSGQVRERLRAARAALEILTGRPVRYFRPPFGAQSLATLFVARSLGLQVVAWGPYAQDWIEQSPAAAAAHALDRTTDGDILLFHDGLEVPEGEVPPTFDRARMIEHVVIDLHARGLRATSVGELLAISGPAKTAWFRA